MGSRRSHAPQLRLRRRGMLPSGSNPVRRPLIVAILALASAAGLIIPASASASPNGIVISEFRFRGPNGGNDEFVELRNTSGTPVDISGYRLEGCSAGGPSGTRDTVPQGTAPLAPGEAFLFANSASGGYSGGTSPDRTYGTGISDTGGVQIRAADGTTVIDAVGSTSTAAACREGSGLTIPTATADNSFERRAGGTQDTDDNAADFEGPKQGNPQARNAPPAGGIVISEFRFRGPGGGNDEFVELRNTSTAPIDISNYRLEGCNTSGPSGERARVPDSAAALAPGESFLFANNAANGYSGSAPPDATYNTGISDTGGARILAADGTTVVDAAGSTTTSANCREGAGLTIPTGDGDNSFERKQGGTQDTDDNAADFEGPQAGDPEGLDDPTPPTRISAVQGPGSESPLRGDTVTIEGVVTGIDDEVGQSSSGQTFRNERGIFVQEEAADRDDDQSTSEGIFVGFVDNPPEPGTVVRVTGEVRELFGFTIIEEDIGTEPLVRGTAPVPDPVDIDESRAEGQDRDERAYYESLEGMRVRLAVGTANSGGTNKFGELFLTPGPEKNRVFRDEDVPGLLATDEDAGSGNPQNPDNPNNPLSTTQVNADLFDTVSDLVGPLAFNFDNYKVMVQEGREPSVQDTGVTYPYTQRTPDGLRPFDDSQIRVVSYNLNNYFDNVDDPEKDDEFDETTDREPEKRQRATDAINNILKRPEVISVQEAENKEVLDRLASSLGGYTAYLEEGNDERGIDVGFLIKDSVEVSNVRQLGKEERGPQGCSDVEGRLFDRPPLAADISTPDGLEFTVFGSHFAAKGGPDGRDRLNCREEQAQFLRAEVRKVVDGGGQAIVAGDLNSFEDEGPLAILEGGGLLDNQWDREPDPEQRYSFQFQGRLQTLDHILITSGLDRRFADFQYAHFNIDYFERERQENQFSTDGHKLSVHDPPVLTLDMQDEEEPPPPEGTCDGEPATLVGTDGDDEITGTSDRDAISARDGDDEVRGREDDDCVEGGDGTDLLKGGEQDDRVVGNGDEDIVVGNQGADELSGSGDDDRLYGNGGGDDLRGGGGDDRVRGHNGNDDLRGNGGDDLLAAQDGERDDVDCGGGEDVAKVDREDNVSRDCERVRATRR